MTKSELIELIVKHKSNFSQILKKLDSALYSEIEAMYDYPSFSQKLYDYIYNPNKKCIVCNNVTQYIGINVGYNTTCSNICKGVLRHTNSVEIRNCVICNNKFEIYKTRKKTTCSPHCLVLLNKTDDVIKKRMESYKKTIKEKYNVDWYSHTDAFKDKLHKHHISGTFDYNSITAKVKTTKLERYGDANYNNPIKNAETMIDKYGVSNYSQTNEFKKVHYNRVINKLTDTIELIGDFSDYSGVVGGKYSFNCKVCDNKFTATLNNGNIPICKTCNPSQWNSSNFEAEVLDYIQSIYNGIVTSSDRTKLKPRELDILLDDINIAIECNGNYWHSERHGKKDKNYHLNKTNECKQNGIRLIHIFEDEWLYKKNIVKSRLANILNHSIKRIYARKCHIAEISSIEKRKFLENTHIQGNDKSHIKLGLFHMGELVGVMTFSKRKIFGNTDWELVRFSTKYNVIGGASKLFSYFVKKFKPVKVITYSDIRWNTGDVYLKMGFVNVGKTSPGYFYLMGNSRINRIQFQKHKLKGKLKVFDETLTEWENMQLNGYDRIWDCGHYKYEWNGFD